MALREIHATEIQLEGLSRTSSRASPEIRAAAEALAKQAKTLTGGAESPGVNGSGLVRVGRLLVNVQEVVNSADATPTSQAETMVEEQTKEANSTLAQWSEMKSKQLENLNQMLHAAGHAPVNPAQEVPADYNPLAANDD